MNTGRALMDKAGSRWEQMDKVSRDGNPKKEPKEMLEIKNNVREMKNAFMNLLVDWMQLRKESQS